MVSRKLIYLAVATAGLVMAANRALLIGVGKYPSYPGVKTLQGPEHDVRSLKQSLVDFWGFRAENIQTLTDSEATKAKILSGLDDLIGKTGQGDFVLIYYSGHGTSFHDAKNRRLGLDMRTGAILPYDVSPGTPAQILRRLIVGAIDLKPRFLELEKKAEVMVLFDSCYSGDSAKFIPQLVSRNAELIPRGDTDLMELIEKAEASTGDWPYRNLVYISAAARHEPAWDIPQRMIDAGIRKTVGNKPHGAFTNSLLIGLSGEADLDHSGTITYQELHQFLLETVQQKYGQTPQLSPKGLNNPITNKPLMAQVKAPVAVGTGEDLYLRVKVDPPTDALAAQLAGLPNMRIAAKEYDVIAEPYGSGYTLTHRSGGKLLFGSLTRQVIIERLRHLAQAQKVMSLKYPKQRFNVNLAVEDVTDSIGQTEGVYPAGSNLRLTMKPDVNAWLLLLNVDVEGTITVIYPYRAEEIQETKAGAVVVAVESVVNTPFGTEGLKVFAFSKRPKGIEAFVGGKVTGPEELAELNKLLETGDSQTSRIVLSIPKQ